MPASGSTTADAAGATVRPGTPQDAERIAAVHVGSWRVAYRGVVPDRILKALSVERRAAWWREAIGRVDETRAWVVEHDGQLVGFAATGPARDDDLGAAHGEVLAIYLDPAVWSRGLGRLLFATAVDDLRARGLRQLVLWVLTLNTRGRRFYEAAGWRPDGTSRMLDFDGTPVEEVRYAPALPPD